MAKRPRSNRIDTYIDRLESGDVQTRRKAALKLSRWSNIVVVRHLCIALQDSDRHVRRDAAKSLGIIGDSSAVEPLVNMVRSDTSVGAIRWGVRALGHIADPAAVPALLRVAVRAKSRLEVTAREAIDEIGTRAVGELCKSLNLPDDPLHAEAYAGIKRLYRRRRPPLGSFPGGSVIEAVMTAGGLLPQQRIMGIEAALSCRLLYRTPERISADAARLCERLAAQHGDEAIRRNAEIALNYVSLGRPSDIADRPDLLLRAVKDNGGAQDGRETLGRAHSRPTGTTSAPPNGDTKDTWHRVISRIRSRWFTG